MSSTHAAILDLPNLQECDKKYSSHARRSHQFALVNPTSCAYGNPRLDKKLDAA